LEFTPAASGGVTAVYKSKSELQVMHADSFQAGI
jgi:hypothetical protein